MREQNQRGSVSWAARAMKKKTQTKNMYWELNPALLQILMIPDKSL